MMNDEKFGQTRTGETMLAALARLDKSVAEGQPPEKFSAYPIEIQALTISTAKAALFRAFPGLLKPTNPQEQTARDHFYQLLDVLSPEYRNPANASVFKTIELNLIRDIHDLQNKAQS